MVLQNEGFTMRTLYFLLFTTIALFAQENYDFTVVSQTTERGNAGKVQYSENGTVFIYNRHEGLFAYSISESGIAKLALLDTPGYTDYIVKNDIIYLISFRKGIMVYSFEKDQFNLIASGMPGLTYRLIDVSPEGKIYTSDDYGLYSFDIKGNNIEQTNKIERDWYPLEIHTGKDGVVYVLPYLDQLQVFQEKGKTFTVYNELSGETLDFSVGKDNLLYTSKTNEGLVVYAFESGDLKKVTSAQHENTAVSIEAGDFGDLIVITVSQTKPYHLETWSLGNNNLLMLNSTFFDYYYQNHSIGPDRKFVISNSYNSVTQYDTKLDRKVEALIGGYANQLTTGADQNIFVANTYSGLFWYKYSDDNFELVENFPGEIFNVESLGNNLLVTANTNNSTLRLLEYNDSGIREIDMVNKDYLGLFIDENSLIYASSYSQGLDIYSAEKNTLTEIAHLDGSFSQVKVREDGVIFLSGTNGKDLYAYKRTDKSFQLLGINEIGKVFDFAFGENDIVYSTDNGYGLVAYQFSDDLIWRELANSNDYCENLYIHSIKVLKDGNVLVAARNNKLYTFRFYDNMFSMIGESNNLNAISDDIEIVNDNLLFSANGVRGLYAINIDKVTGITNSIEPVTEYQLAQNYPNPFNPETTISFSLPEASNVKLNVYNLLGEKVASLINNNLSAGTHTAKFNANNLSSGVYIYKLDTPEFTETRKMLLLK